MTRNTIIALSIIALVAVCCVGPAVAVGLGGVFLSKAAENAIVESPEEAAQVGQSILPYTLPPGYHEQVAFNLLGNRMVIIGPKPGEPGIIIILGGFNAALAGNQEEMRRQMEQSLAQQGQTGNLQLTPVSSEQIIINDTPTALTIFEGVDEQGTAMRQEVATFATHGSTGMVMLVGPVAEWDAAAADAFLASIR